MASLNVLALNSGSSTLKFGLYRIDTAAAFGASGAELLISGDARIKTDAGDHDALHRIQRQITDAGLPLPEAIGHRIVHGGPTLRQHCLIDSRVLQQIEAAAPLAPLHTAPELAIIRAAQSLYPELQQAACFDTAFHASLPELASTLPIPKALRALGIQRYGFHGLSCESILHQLGPEPPARIIVAHLGNGASVTAIRAGLSVDTSMGLTPNSGCIMGTRCGDLDPGLAIWLIREQRLSGAVLEILLDRHSGLLGISGVSSDMRKLHTVADENADARLAIAMFCRSVAKQIAAMTVALDGLDLLVFTGGIGENDAAVRDAICGDLRWISFRQQVLGCREDEQIARHTTALAASADLGALSHTGPT